MRDETDCSCGQPKALHAGVPDGANACLIAGLRAEVASLTRERDGLRDTVARLLGDADAARAEAERLRGALERIAALDHFDYVTYGEPVQIATAALGPASPGLPEPVDETGDSTTKNLLVGAGAASSGTPAKCETWCGQGQARKPLGVKSWSRRNRSYCTEACLGAAEAARLVSPVGRGNRVDWTCPTCKRKCTGMAYDGPYCHANGCALAPTPPDTTPSRPKESGVCASWCGTRSVDLVKTRAWYAKDGKNWNAGPVHCSEACRDAGRSLHPAPGTATAKGTTDV